jgi:hypothetical protein
MFTIPAPRPSATLRALLAVALVVLVALSGTVVVLASDHVHHDQGARGLGR